MEVQNNFESNATSAALAPNVAYHKFLARGSNPRHLCSKKMVWHLQIVKKIEVSRAPRNFDSDLIKFGGKVWTSRTASFRGQENFPMMSGYVPMYTKRGFKKKKFNFCGDIIFGQFRDSSWCKHQENVMSGMMSVHTPHNTSWCLKRPLLESKFPSLLVQDFFVYPSFCAIRTLFDLCLYPPVS